MKKIAVVLLLCSATAAMAQTPGKRVNVDCMDKTALDRYERAFQRIRSRKPADDPKADEFHKSYRYYARLHNGNPGGKAFCNHMNELFLPWHRAALRIFERALQEADKENGGDGSVMLPYWQWTEKPTGTFYPKSFENDPPLQPTGAPRRVDARKNPLYSTAEVRDKIDNARSWRQLGGKPCIDPDCVKPAPDPCPTCTKRGGGAIEDPFHNEVHDWIGGDMESDTTAATDPLFWSFHAYIDLLFDQWQRDNNYPALGCPDCAFRGMTGWTPKLVEHVEDMGYAYDLGTCAPAKGKLAAASLASQEMMTEVAHNTRSAAAGPLVFDIAVPTGYFRTAEIELAGAELPSDFSYAGEVYLYPAAAKLDLASSAFRRRWSVGRFAVWALHEEPEHDHGGDANLFVDATTEMKYIRKHQPGSTWKVAVVVDSVRATGGKGDAKALRSRIVIDDVKIILDRGRETSR